jgi:hypothetical protein
MTELAKWEETKWAPREARGTVTTFIPNDDPTLAKLNKVYDKKVTFADKAILTSGFMSQLKERYEVTDDVAVRDFLKEHPFLIQLLFEAHKKIQELFGPELRLTLKVVADPEALGERELFVFIQTRLHPKQARALLAQLGREWWLDAMLDAKGEMTISLEYV